MFLASIGILEVLIHPHAWSQRVFPFAVPLPIATYVLAKAFGGRLHAESFANDALDAAALLGTLGIVATADLNRNLNDALTACPPACVYGLSLLAAAVFLGLPQIYAYLKHVYARKNSLPPS